RVPARLRGTLTSQHALEIAIPRDAAQDEHDGQIPPNDLTGYWPATVPFAKRRHKRSQASHSLGVAGPRLLQAAGARQRKRQRSEHADRDHTPLERAAIGDDPQ